MFEHPLYPYHSWEDPDRVGTNVEVSQTGEHVELQRQCPDGVVAHGQPTFMNSQACVSSQ